MRSIILRFNKATSGATAIEYGLIAAMVSVVIIGALALLGPQLAAVFESITTALGGAAPT